MITKNASPAIYTIGHSNLEPQDFIRLLKSFKIEILVDVRSKPYSQYAVWFNKGEIEELCENNGLKYLFLGNLLGGKPEDKSVSLRTSKVDYDLLRKKSYFLSGIEKLSELSQKNRACIMCSEAHPDECHRYLLIAPALEEAGIRVVHILPEGSALTSEQLRIEAAHGQLALF